MSDNIQRFTSINGDFFIEEEGELKAGDWFKSKFRSENKFFHFVQVGAVVPEGLICYETRILYPFTDVICKVRIDYDRWYQEKCVPHLNKIV